MSNILSALQWRYATKKFNQTKKLTSEQLDLLVEAVRLAPSSFGLQPYKIVVVTDPVIRQKLSAAAWGQPQIMDSSHLIVFAAKTNITAATVDEFVQMMATARDMSSEQISALSDMMKGLIISKSASELVQWATRQAYIALGVLLTAAALEQIDAAPMEGFNPKQFDVILGLDKLNLATVVIAGLGFRTEDDPTAKLVKVRFPRTDIVLQN